jgi:hypothetical protein
MRLATEREVSDFDQRAVAECDAELATRPRARPHAGRSGSTTPSGYNATAVALGGDGTVHDILTSRRREELPDGLRGSCLRLRRLRPDVDRVGACLGGRREQLGMTTV